MRFEYREFCSIPKDRLERKTVFEILEKILFGYGVGELDVLLSDAAKAIVEKLRRDPMGMRLRGDPSFYRYGQTVVQPGSRATPSSRATPAANLVPTIEDNMW